MQIRFTALLACAIFGGSATEVCAQPGDTIRQYQYSATAEGYDLVLREVPRPSASRGQVLVRVRANALNRGELNTFIVAQRAGDQRRNGMIPLADGAGDVIEIGTGVTEFAVGDRVVGTFFTDWEDGKMPPTGLASMRAGSPHGMASEIVVTTPRALVRIPDYMSYAEAAALPTTGVTAWNALFVAGDIQPGEYVLFEGTGGMSIIGLQLTTAIGARPIITSSSNEKLARARELGAIGTINYRENPDWQLAVRAKTNNVGVDHVLDIGGAETQDKAIEALAHRGHLAIAGNLTGAAPPLDPAMLVAKGLKVSGVLVGSRADFEALLSFMAEHQIHPLIDRTFPFDELPAAYDFMRHGSFMGKIVLTM